MYVIYNLQKKELPFWTTPQDINNTNDSIVLSHNFRYSFLISDQEALNSSPSLKWPDFLGEPLIKASINSRNVLILLQE